MSLPYYKFFPTEHLGNYKEMSLEDDELGIYYKLCVLQLWQHQGRIPDDPRYICSILVTTPEQWAKCRAKFLQRGLIQIIDGNVTDAMLQVKWSNAKEYSEEQSNKRKGRLQQKREQRILRANK